MTAKGLDLGKDNFSPVSIYSHTIYKIKKTVWLPVKLRIQVIEAHHLKKYFISKVSFRNIVYRIACFIILVQYIKLSLIHISEPTRRTPISYAVFCLKK